MKVAFYKNKELLLTIKADVSSPELQKQFDLFR